jgi:predicted ATP-dependent endonuclease of OLD family
MKIKSVRIQNFRSFSDQTIALDDYTCLVGGNGSGKSNVLCALNVLFRETGESPTDLTLLQEEDFHNKKVGEPVRITVTFNSLTKDAKEDFKDYVRQEELVVTAEARFDPVTRTAPVKQYGQRKGMIVFSPYFAALGDAKPVKELKELYTNIRQEVATLPAPGTKDAMTAALRDYEASKPDLCELIPSEDQFYGVSKGANRLAKYVQWVFVPAVKDATSEQIENKNTALGKLLARTVRASVNFEDEIEGLRERAQQQYAELIQAKQGSLNSLSTSLQKRLAEWAHPDAALRLAWRQDVGKSVQVQDPVAEIIAGESGFEGNLSRFGHGLQRSYLLALLQELAGSEIENAPRLILACEEPELYQHPPQARHLAGVLRQLSTRNSQVVVCTHSPYFVTGESFESVRLVRKPRQATESSVTALTLETLGRSIATARGEALPKVAGILAKINQALQPSLNEIFFTPALVLVEGLEDVAYIATYLHLLGLWDECRRLGLYLVPANGKSHMIEPLAATTLLSIPVFIVFDSDGHEARPDVRPKHEKDNRTLLNLCGLTGEQPFQAATLWKDKCVMWTSEMGPIIDADFTEQDRQRFKEAGRLSCGQVGGLDKNALFIAAYLMSAWDAGQRSPTLARLCEAIIQFARAAASPSLVSEAPAAAVV